MKGSKINKYKDIIGKNVKFIREQVMMDTQAEFVKRIGLSQGFISDVEKGKKIPGGEFFVAMYHLLDFDLNFLVSGEGDIYRAPQDNDLITIGKRIRFVRTKNLKTEKEFADDLEIGLHEYICIEQDQIAPTETLLILLSHKYKEPISWLKNGGERKDDQQQQHDDSSKETSLNNALEKAKMESLKKQIMHQNEIIKTKNEIIQSLKDTIAIQKEILSSIPKP